MYHIIGLKQDGRMVLWALKDERPTFAALEGAAKICGYTQLLVTESSGGQIVRFEANLSLLRQVELV